LTWVIDLLPYWPTQAIQAISAYILAHAQQLPDGRLSGLGDCIDLISAKYLDKSDPKESLTNLTDRHFEVVIASLYKKIGYEVVLTKKSRDGGFDVSAQRAMGRGQEHLLVECKKYSGAVGVQVVRQLLGVISASKVTKGVIVTTSRFTKPALQFADEHKRIELIDYGLLNGMLNKYIGPAWPKELERTIAIEQAKLEMQTERKVA